MKEQNKVQALNLSDADKLAMAQAVYGEQAQPDVDIQKMIIQTMLNRLRSPKDTEFGATMPEILKKGYYAVSNPNVPYQEALAGKREVELGNIKKLIDAIIGDQDFGEAQFYFRPEEVEKMKQKGSFNFNAVRPLKLVGPYQTYGY